MDADKYRRLVEHLDAIEEVRIKPLNEAGGRGVPAVTEATQIIDALALAEALMLLAGDTWDVVGESFRQDALERVAATRIEDLVCRVDPADGRPRAHSGAWMTGGIMAEDQGERSEQGRLQELLDDVKETASDLKEKAEDLFEDAKDKLEVASDEREAVRRSEDEAARRETDTFPGPGASVITP